MDTEKKIFPVVGIVPSLNPDALFVGVVKGLLEGGMTDVIVVDDGSREDCKHFFREAGELEGVTVLTHDVNKGKGCALKTAFEYYLENFDQEKYCGVVTADADGQHLTEDIMLTVQQLIEKTSPASKNKNPDVMILGTRDFNEKNVPPKSRIGNKTTTLLFKLLYGKWIHDTQTGLRAFSNSFTRKCLGIKGERFEYEINMLIYSVSEKVEIAEQLIQTVYFDSNRETHFRPIADSFKIYRVMFGSFFRFIAASFISFVVDWGLFSILNMWIFGALLKPEIAINIKTAVMDPIAFNWAGETLLYIPLATAIARVISSILNFVLNQRMVFKKKSGTSGFVWKYFTLWFLQMTASALGVMGLESLGLTALIAKVVVDVILFFVSYQVQRLWVFKEKKK